MASKPEFQEAMLEAMTRVAKGSNASASTLLKLAEAYAWLVAPAQPHGGELTVGK